MNKFVTLVRPRAVMGQAGQTNPGEELGMHCTLLHAAGCKGACEIWPHSSGIQRELVCGLAKSARRVYNFMISAAAASLTPLSPQARKPVLTRNAKQSGNFALLCPFGFILCLKSVFLNAQVRTFRTDISSRSHTHAARSLVSHCSHGSSVDKGVYVTKS